MIGRYIDTNFLYEFSRDLEAAVTSGQDPFSVLGQKITAVGFSSVRVFFVSPDYITGRSIFVPRYLYPEPKDFDFSDHQVFADDTFAQGKVSARPISVVRARGDELGRNESLANLHAAMGIEDSFFYIVPIHRDEKVIGKISLSLTGGEDVLHKEEDTGLLLLSRIFEKYLRRCLHNKADKAKRRISLLRRDDPEVTIDQITFEIAQIVQSTLSGMLTSVFIHSWIDDKLHKVAEACGVPGEISPFPETYLRGSFLTGKALIEQDCRVVFDVSAAAKKDDVKVEKASFGRHTELIGEELSLLYAPVVTQYQSWLIRIFNRDHAYGTAFDLNDVYLANLLSTTIADTLSLYWTSRTFNFLANVASSSVRDFGDYEGIIENFRKTLSETQSVQPILVGRQSDGESLEFVYGVDDAALAAGFDNAGFDRVKKTLNGEFWVISEAGITSAIPALNQAREGYRLVHIFDVSTDEIEGLLLIFSSTSAPSQAVRAAMTEKGREILRVFCAFLANSVSAKVNHLNMEDAKRLIGQIGHELEEPISKYQSQAETGYFRIENKINEREFPVGLRTKIQPLIDSSMLRMSREAEEIALLMKVAISMAKSSHTEIDVTFSKLDIKDRLLEKESLVRRICSREHKRVSARLELHGLDGIEVIADEWLLDKALDNLLINAAKYSNPPGGGRPIPIVVRYKPHIDEHRIEFENWGVPLAQSDFETIFRPFYRGSLKDNIKSRKGMGLGLYIARRFAKAHNGNVVCTASQPTLGDPFRRASEGFRTTFELRISKRLEAGAHTVTV